MVDSNGNLTVIPALVIPGEDGKIFFNHFSPMSALPPEATLNAFIRMSAGSTL
jgi:hypothetical protein